MADAGTAPVIVDMESLYRPHGDTAKQSDLLHYEEAARRQAGEGADVILTGRAPIWLYLRIAHALHGTVRSLTYRAPEAGDVLIFDHTSR